MEFAEFAAQAAGIEAETADLEIVDLVTDLFLDADDDLAVVSRFVQGRIFPAWQSRTLDIGPNLCYEAIARAAGRNVSADDVEEKLVELGDIGAVAASYEFGGQQSLAAFGADAERTLTVAEVFAELDALAGVEGSGSQDTKIRRLQKLFNESTPEEARYLARLVLSEMRIGVGEGSVRDAIAGAFDVPVEEVERALQVSNDYGLVAETARDEGAPGLGEMQLEIGRPVQAMLAQAGTVTDALESWEETAVEWKFDGARCVSGFTPIYTRERGLTVVRDIEVDDKVLTHRGRFRKVVAKNRRTIDRDERVFEFSTYLGESFKVTEGHEMLVRSSMGPVWRPVEQVSVDDEMVFPIPTLEGVEEPPEILRLHTISNYVKTFEVNERFFQFLGYWVGDGTTNTYNGNQRISLVFNNEDSELRCTYREIVEEELGINPDRIGEYDHGGATSIYWTDRPLMEWLAQKFRRNDQDGWREKTVPEWFWNISRPQFEAFLQGWHDADGWLNNGKKYISTKDRELATTIQLIGLRFDRILGFRRVRKNDETYYRLTFTNSERHARIEDGRVLIRILTKEELSRNSPREVDPRQTVYNLQVEEDESYCVPLMAMHNCQIHYTGDGVSVFSRNMEDVTEPLPEVVEFVEENLSEPAILDGEVVATDEDGKPLPFQQVLRRFRRKHDVAKARENVELELRAFDCLHADGTDLLDVPLTERHDHLREVLGSGVSALRVTDDADEIADIEADALEAGHEGIMLKNPASTYSPGRRGKNWLKRKPDVETLDLVVTGAEWGEGRRASFLGTFLLSARTDSVSESHSEAHGTSFRGGYETIGKVATGITDEELAELTELLEPHVRTQDGQEVDIEPAVVFEVGYEEIQESPTYSSGYALRFPRFLGVRDDKNPADADSLERVERLATEQ